MKKERRRGLSRYPAALWGRTDRASPHDWSKRNALRGRVRMLIIWSGLGARTILIVGLVSIVVAVVLNLAFAPLGYPQLTVHAAGPGLWAGAAANWYAGKRRNSAPPRELLDTKTGERVLLARRHRLFWIQMEYWSIPVALPGLFWLVLAVLFTPGP